MEIDMIEIIVNILSKMCITITNFNILLFISIIFEITKPNSRKKRERKVFTEILLEMLLFCLSYL